MVGYFITIALLSLAGLIGFLFLFNEIKKKQTVPEIKVTVTQENNRSFSEQVPLKNPSNTETNTPMLNPADLLKYTPTTSHIRWDKEWEDSQ